jgi:F-type H+-transporting ATPase subunit a
VAAEGSNSIDALGQFQLHPALGAIGGSVNFTQSNLMMVIAGLGVIAFLYMGMKPRAMVPGRLQAAVEMGYETIMSMCTETIGGHEGRKFFPFVFTLFFFILFGNLLGVFPLFFTFTSHIMVTLALSLFVFVLVTVVGIRAHGLHWFTYFVPQGIPKALAPLMVLIEVISYLSRIISLSVRLFANMMAGHTMLKVFGAFVVALGLLGGWAPLAFMVAFTGLEILVAFLQAYVFAILTCIYLNDALHIHH